MRSLTPLAGGIALGALAFWLVTAVFLVDSSADHPTGPGKFADWTGPKDRFLHIYLWTDESGGCPTAVNAIPTDEAAEIWKRRGTQPKRIVWKLRSRSDADEWIIETKSGTDDHLPGKKIIPPGADDAFWSEKPNPIGPPISVGQKEYWKWMYEVTVKRDGCADTTLDPPVYIRRR